MLKMNNLKGTQKWLLASALLVVLGIQLNWDPTASIIARNDMGIHEVEMAQSSPPGSATGAPAVKPGVPAPAPAPAVTTDSTKSGTDAAKMDPAAAQKQGTTNNWLTVENGIGHVDLHKLDPDDFPEVDSGGAKMTMKYDVDGHIILREDSSSWTTANADGSKHCVNCALKLATKSTETISEGNEQNLRGIVIKAMQDKQGNFVSRIAKEIDAENALKEEVDSDTSTAKEDGNEDVTVAKKDADKCAGKQGHYMLDCATNEYNNHLAKCETYQNQDLTLDKSGKLKEKARACEHQLDLAFKNLTKEMALCAKNMGTASSGKSKHSASNADEKLTDSDCEDLDSTAHDIISESYRKGDVAQCVKFVEKRLGKELNDMEKDMASSGANKFQIQQALYQKMLEETGAIPMCSLQTHVCAASTQPHELCMGGQGPACIGGTMVGTGGDALLSEINENPMFEDNGAEAQKLFNKNFFNPYAMLAAQTSTDMETRRNLTGLTAFDFTTVGGNLMTGSSNDNSTIATNIPMGNVVPFKMFNPNINMAGARPLGPQVGPQVGGAMTVNGGNVGNGNNIIRLSGGSVLPNYGTQAGFMGGMQAPNNSLFASNPSSGYYNQVTPMSLPLSSSAMSFSANGSGSSMLGNMGVGVPGMTIPRSGGALPCNGTVTQCRAASNVVH